MADYKIITQDELKAPHKQELIAFIRYFIMITTMLAGLFSQAAAYSAPLCEAEISSIFQGKQGCFLLYNLSKSRYDMTYGGEVCDARVSPASTFKIPNSLIVLDSGIVKDENTLYTWDGSKQTIKEHEHDHTLASAVKYSVVWYFQKIAAQLGEARYHDYLKRFDYGNEDISGGLTTFWLSSSLAISPKEQIAFLAKLYRNQLPVSTHASATVKKILVLESSPTGTLSGKTGSATVSGINIGWFIGHILSGNTEYLFATTVQQKGTDYKIDHEYGGLKAKTLTKEILSCREL